MDQISPVRANGIESGYGKSSSGAEDARPA